MLLFSVVAAVMYNLLTFLLIKDGSNRNTKQNLSEKKLPVPTAQ